MAARLPRSEDLNEKPKLIKSEFDDFMEENHSHCFILKFSGSENKFTISCDRPQTVLEAIKSNPIYNDKSSYDDEYVVVQMGEGPRGTAIATHFPCSCLQGEELITLSFRKEKVEELKESFDRSVFPKEDYVLFYIETRGGLNAKTKAQKGGLFRSSAMKEFSQLCVYGTKEMTVEKAIERDGRFSNSLGSFKLADVTKDKLYTFSSDSIDKHHGKTFQICFEIGKKGTLSKAEKAEKVSKLKALAKPRSVPVAAALKKVERSQPEVDEIYKLLCDQFLCLKKEMLDRFPGDTLEQALEKVDFGKAQQSFSDVYRLEKLLKLGKSVCKLIVGSIVEGTAFVLFNSYILTNAHLFDKVVHNDTLNPDIEIHALFNYENPHPNDKSFFFCVKNMFIDMDKELDYAILELDLCGQEENKVPQGLLKMFSAMPDSGEACIIGHPSGGIKKIDPTCIIEKTRRTEVIKKHLEQIKDTMIPLALVKQQLKDQCIDNILMIEKQMQSVSTYDTFMYHGSSGSPVFDAECKVFGLHMSGFLYGVTQKQSIIEVARPVLLIFEKFVMNQKKNGMSELLRQIQEESKGNKHLEAKLDDPEPMDID